MNELKQCHSCGGARRYCGCGRTFKKEKVVGNNIVQFVDDYQEWAKEKWFSSDKMEQEFTDKIMGEVSNVLANGNGNLNAKGLIDISNSVRMEVSELLKGLVSAFGIGGESGEFLEKVKKKIRGDEITDEQIINELGDVLFYIAIQADYLGYSLSEVFEANIRKLDDRFERGMQRGSGDNR